MATNVPFHIRRQLNTFQRHAIVLRSYSTTPNTPSTTSNTPSIASIIPSEPSTSNDEDLVVLPSTKQMMDDLEKIDTHHLKDVITQLNNLSTYTSKQLSLAKNLPCNPRSIPSIPPYTLSVLRSIETYKENLESEITKIREHLTDLTFEPYPRRKELFVQTWKDEVQTMNHQEQVDLYHTMRLREKGMADRALKASYDQLADASKLKRGTSPVEAKLNPWKRSEAESGKFTLYKSVARAFGPKIDGTKKNPWAGGAAKEVASGSDDADADAAKLTPQKLLRRERRRESRLDKRRLRRQLEQTIERRRGEEPKPSASKSGSALEDEVSKLQAALEAQMKPKK